MTLNGQEKRMFEVEDRISINRNIFSIKESDSRTGNITAGYTYLGQMIAHDIVPSTNNFQSRSIDSKEVSPVLNLDSIYHKKFYDNKKVFNRFGQFKFKKISRIKNADFVRIKGVAQIPEPRNDENVIVAQLHMVWQKLHNKIIEENYKKLIKDNEIGKIEAIKESRKIVTYIFQQVVLDDYLKKILAKDIYELYSNNCYDLILYSKANEISRIPLEFSHAAFRFGHSMVRNTYNISKYNINRVKKIKLKKLFKTKKQKKLKKFQLIDWVTFFKTGEENTPQIIAQGALKIDTKISQGMVKIPELKNHDIIEINLMANKLSEIHTGNEIYQQLYDTYDEFKAVLDKKETVYRNINNMNLLLWPYILKEADKISSGSGLGIIGSIIVAEVLLLSINTYRNSLNELIKKEAKTILDKITNPKEPQENGKITMSGIINYINED